MGWYAETGLTLVGDRYADSLNTVVRAIQESGA